MKLSEMNTDKMMDVLAAITPEIGQITQDKDLMATFRTKKPAEESTIEFGLNRLLNLIPQICTRHKQPVYRILSVLNEKSVDEIAAQKGVQTIKEIKDAIQDPELTGFFSQSKPTEPEPS